MFKKITLCLVLGIASFSFAKITCDDVVDGNENYHENMEKISSAVTYGTSRDFDKYQELIVSSLCKGDNDTLEWLIDDGYKRRSEVEAFREELGLGVRSDSGLLYEKIHTGLLDATMEAGEDGDFDIGISNAGASSLAKFYVENPNSKCNEYIDKVVVSHDKDAMKILKSMPNFCK